MVELTLTLPRGWRQRGDISWRASSWGLRRIAGGLLLEPLTAGARKKAGIADGAMALRVKYLGNNGPHGAAYRAGVRQGDVVVSYDDRSDLLREGDLLVRAQEHKAGEPVAVTVLRDGKKISMKLEVQE